MKLNCKVLLQYFIVLLVCEQLSADTS